MESERSAIVLAGGRGSRMGQPKAGLKLGGITMLARTMGELERAFGDIVIVAAPRRIAQPWLPGGGARVVFDDDAFGGPLSALWRGLVAARGEVAFACACDLPFLRAELAIALCAMIDRDEAAIPIVGGRPQVLCAAYRKRTVSVLAEMAARGERRLTGILEHLRVRRVAESELRPYDPDLSSFVNLNTPADYERARALLEKG